MSTTVRVPASTSNLGAGFDCIGAAVDRWLEVTIDVAQRTTFERAGTLAGLEIPESSDRVLVGFNRACNAAEQNPPPGISVRATSQIPVARGLGSSAAATVAGAAAANALFDLGLSTDQLIRICAAIDGHPDNVTPAVLGGATLTIPTLHGWISVQLDVARELSFVFAVPDFEVETRAARAMLPQTVPHEDAVIQASRAAALPYALKHARGDMLAESLRDKLHVDYRRPLLRGYDDVVSAATFAGAFGATLSGSGSTIVAIARNEFAHAVADAMCEAWGALEIPAEAIVSPATVPGHSVTQ